MDDFWKIFAVKPSGRNLIAGFIRQENQWIIYFSFDDLQRSEAKGRYYYWAAPPIKVFDFRHDKKYKMQNIQRLSLQIWFQ